MSTVRSGLIKYELNLNSLSKKRIIVWFRRDLRLSDNPALRAAISDADEVYPVFIWSPQEESPWEPGAASKWWLHYSLESLTQSLSKKGSQLIIRSGDSFEELIKLTKETKADSVYWNRLYEPKIVSRDKKIKSSFKKVGIEAKSFASYLLLEPWEIANSSQKPFQVFTPFWRKLKSNFATPDLFSAPREIPSIKNKISSLLIEDLKLLPKINWDLGLKETWSPGESAAKKALKDFISKKIADYLELRDYPSEGASSKISAYLHFGEISPRQIWRAVEDAVSQGKIRPSAADDYLRQVVWREFSAHLLFHFSDTDLKPLRKEFLKFPWKKNKKLLLKWQNAKTGYPIVDAGMNELWQTGIMHNRVRMIVASFLVKHLLQPWQDGAKWFWDTLVDADLANNSMGWQWTAGCGADAAPYFRVFNPILQGEKFDSRGEYVRKWLPELSDLPNKYIHQPWSAPSDVLDEAGVRLGENYPLPIVDHREAREAALDAYEQLKNAK